MDRFSLSNCELVVVGSLRRPVMEGLDTTSRRRGVEGGNAWLEDGAVGVATLLTEDCEE